MTKPTRRQLLRTGSVLMASMVLGATLVSCSGEPEQSGSANDESKPLQSVSIMTPLGHSISYADMYVAKELGFWEAQGLDVEILAGQGTAVAVQATIGGAADYSETGGLSTIVAVETQDAPIIHIGTIRQTSQFELLSLPENPITPKTDLRGLRIGIVSAGGGTESIVQLMAAEAGYSPSEISTPITGVGLAAYELAVGGKVDGWVSVNTDRAVLEAAGKEVHSFSVDELVLMPSQTLVTTLDVVESDSDIPVRLLQGLLEAMYFVVDPANEAKVVESVQKYNSELEESALITQLPFLIETWGDPADFLKMNPATWVGAQKALKAVGTTTSSVPLERLIDTKYVDQLVRR